jgi:hypothetical protein
LYQSIALPVKLPLFSRHFSGGRDRCPGPDAGEFDNSSFEKHIVSMLRAIPLHASQPAARKAARAGARVAWAIIPKGRRGAA